MLSTKATGITVTRAKPTMAGENGERLFNVILSSHTSADTTQAIRKAIKGVLLDPCLGCVLVTAVRLIPASAGPQVATAANGNSKNIPLFSTAL